MRGVIGAEWLRFQQILLIVAIVARDCFFEVCLAARISELLQAICYLIDAVNDICTIVYIQLISVNSELFCRTSSRCYIALTPIITLSCLCILAVLVLLGGNIGG